MLSSFSLMVLHGSSAVGCRGCMRALLYTSVIAVSLGAQNSYEQDAIRARVEYALRQSQAAEYCDSNTRYSTSGKGDTVLCMVLLKGKTWNKDDVDYELEHSAEARRLRFKGMNFYHESGSNQGKTPKLICYGAFVFKKK